MSASSPGGTTLSLDHVIALNDELAALARIGVPMELGLAELGRDTSGKLSKISLEIVARLQAGEPLESVLGDARLGLPAGYRAVLQAGIRSGRLAKALEGVAESARRSQELRRALNVALAYPLFVCVIAYALTILMLSYTIPTILDARIDMLQTEAGDWPTLRWLSAHLWHWAPWPPLVGILAIVVLWRRSGKVDMFRPGRVESPRMRIATPARAMTLGRMATFADVLGLLLENHAPLAESLVLAAEASGCKPWGRSAQAIARRLRDGATIESIRFEEYDIPASILWALALGEHSGRLAPSLRRMAEHYRRRARRDIAWLNSTLPLFVTTCVGLFVVLPYALLLFVPWAQAMFQLSEV